MPAIATAVCPHPPLLVPAMAGLAAGELTELRTACDGAIDRLWAASPDLIVVLGGADRTATYDSSAIGTFAGYGVPLSVRLGGNSGATPAGNAVMPLSLAIGAWLLRDRPTAPARIGQTVSSKATAAECAALGASLAGRAARVGLLVMGDGSACHGQKAPGYADERAPSFDAAVTDAFAAADVDALLALDIDVAAELLVAGRAAWQVLAGAVAASGRDWSGSVRFAAAPYGVQYTVATWEPAGGVPRSSGDATTGGASTDAAPLGGGLGTSGGAGSAGGAA